MLPYRRAALAQNKTNPERGRFSSGTLSCPRERADLPERGVHEKGGLDRCLLGRRGPAWWWIRGFLQPSGSEEVPVGVFAHVWHETLLGAANALSEHTGDPALGALVRSVTSLDASGL